MALEHSAQADWLWNAIGTNPTLDTNSASYVNLVWGQNPTTTALYDYGVVFIDQAAITSSTSPPRYDVPLAYENGGSAGDDWGPNPFGSGAYLPIPTGIKLPPLHATYDPPGENYGDAHYCVLDPISTRIMSIWQLERLTSSSYRASFGGVAPLNGDGRENNGTSTGSNIARAAAVVRIADLQAAAQANTGLDHALFMAITASASTFRYPAAKSDGDTVNGVPMGTRFQLDPSINVDAISGISAGEKVIAKTLQTHGVYVGDSQGTVNGGRGSNMIFEFDQTATSTTSPGSTYTSLGLTDYGNMTKIPWSSMRALSSWDTGTSGGTNPTPATEREPPTTGLLRRWRADSVTGVMNNAAVSSWPALAGGTAWAQSTATAQPTYIASGSANAKPCLRFDGTSDFMQATPGSRAQPYTLAMIATPTGLTSQRQFIAGNGGGLQLLHSASAVVQAYAGTALNRSGAISSAPHIITAAYSGTSSYITVDGTTPTTGTTGTNGSGGTWYLGRTDSAARYFSGDIYEVFIYDHVLTQTERATLHSYAQDRYNITVTDYVPPPVQTITNSIASSATASASLSSVVSSSGTLTSAASTSTTIVPETATVAAIAGTASATAVIGGNSSSELYPGSTTYPGNTTYPGSSGGGGNNGGYVTVLTTLEASATASVSMLSAISTSSSILAAAASSAATEIAIVATSSNIIAAADSVVSLQSSVASTSEVTVAASSSASLVSSLDVYTAQQANAFTSAAIDSVLEQTSSLIASTAAVADVGGYLDVSTALIAASSADAALTNVIVALQSNVTSSADATSIVSGTVDPGVILVADGVAESTISSTITALASIIASSDSTAIAAVVATAFASTTATADGVALIDVSVSATSVAIADAYSTSFVQSDISSISALIAIADGASGLAESRISTFATIFADAGTSASVDAVLTNSSDLIANAAALALAVSDGTLALTMTTDATSAASLAVQTTAVADLVADASAAGTVFGSAETSSVLTATSFSTASVLSAVEVFNVLVADALAAGQVSGSASTDAILSVNADAAAATSGSSVGTSGSLAADAGGEAIVTATISTVEILVASAAAAASSDAAVQVVFVVNAFGVTTATIFGTENTISLDTLSAVAVAVAAVSGISGTAMTVDAASNTTSSVNSGIVTPTSGVLSAAASNAGLLPATTALLLATGLAAVQMLQTLNSRRISGTMSFEVGVVGDLLTIKKMLGEALANIDIEYAFVERSLDSTADVLGGLLGQLHEVHQLNGHVGIVVNGIADLTLSPIYIPVRFDAFGRLTVVRRTEATIGLDVDVEGTVRAAPIRLPVSIGEDGQLTSIRRLVGRMDVAVELSPRFVAVRNLTTIIQPISFGMVYAPEARTIEHTQHELEDHRSVVYDRPFLLVRD